MMDDYVLPSEPVMDYLTRFSGLTAEDLDPTASRHHLVTQRTAYLKLRYLIDRGYVPPTHPPTHFSCFLFSTTPTHPPLNPPNQSPNQVTHPPTHPLTHSCILVGHGLKKDFRITNIYVPPAQVIDTVDLWWSVGQRKVSLRFLASFLLGESIQGETHDSIEDARTALRLYRRWEEEQEKGTFEKTLMSLYEFGRKTGWKLQQVGGGEP